MFPTSSVGQSKNDSLLTVYGSSSEGVTVCMIWLALGSTLMDDLIVGKLPLIGDDGNKDDGSNDDGGAWRTQLNKSRNTAGITSMVADGPGSLGKKSFN
ncbi:MAG: hypothetical protein M1830_008249 [Pleopsidium flavum]|nr:MAG: hypothetical protein M1830_008249 [Pleopsidium flavum]